MTKGWKSKDRLDIKIQLDEQQKIVVRKRGNSIEFLRIAPLRQLHYRAIYLTIGLIEKCSNLLSEELESGLAFKLLPVVMAIGIIVYFLLPAEPVLSVVVASLLGLLWVISRMTTRARLYYAAAIIACVFLGVVTASFSVIRNKTPVVERQITTNVTGSILAVQQNRRGSPRYLIKPFVIEKLEHENYPKRLRLSAASRHIPFKPGDVISGLVRMQPISGPAYPGSYDFFFHSWFLQLGGSGFFMGKPSRVERPDNLSLIESATVFLNQSRQAIETRIKTALPGPNGDLAVALVTGNRTLINPKTQDSLRNAGLAHVLAISGLHMGLVALTTIGLLRLLFAFSPNFSQNFSVRKWATAAGFITATGYLFLSGAGVATQRAWVMISIMLIAVILDRRAITMRSVALSAGVILTISPESIFSPGFHMSFAAVAALVAGYELLSKRRLKPNLTSHNNQGPIRRSFSILLRYFSGLALTSLIAGTATGFFAAWHFHRVATLGLLANVLAMPFAGIVVMPMGLLSVVLMPYGLDFIPLAIMGWGIDRMVEIAIWVDGLSDVGGTGIINPIAIFMFVSGLIILTLFSTKLRWIGLMPMLLIPFFWQASRVPDILVSENGRSIAIRGNTHGLRLLYPRRNKFVSDIWIAAWGEEEIVGGQKPENCSNDICITDITNGLKLHVVYDPELLKTSCRQADILIAPRLWWVNCKETKKPKLILKRYDFEQSGTHAIYLDKPEHADQVIIRIDKALENTGRPWQRSVNPVKTISDIDGSNRQASPEL